MDITLLMYILVPSFYTCTKNTLLVTRCTEIDYPPEVSSMKYCCLGVFREEYFRLTSANRKH